MIHEYLRYRLAEGAAPRMATRFRELTIPLCRRHGITIVHTWLDEQTFSYIVEFDDGSARDRAWRRYHDDADYLARSEEVAELIISVERHVLTPLAEPLG